jgi:hypothetical protein
VPLATCTSSTSKDEEQHICIWTVYTSPLIFVFARTSTIPDTLGVNTISDYFSRAASVTPGPGTGGTGAGTDAGTGTGIGSSLRTGKTVPCGLFDDRLPFPPDHTLAAYDAQSTASGSAASQIPPVSVEHGVGVGIGIGVQSEHAMADVISRSGSGKI